MKKTYFSFQNALVKRQQGNRTFEKLCPGWFKNKTNEENKIKLLDTENKLVIARREAVGGGGGENW